ncbi:MAG TPA: IS1595 family transposase [Acidimicrobiales bacterium]|nr:IS1595 family transposase [Acidimicrobiales bacterium]
MEPLNLSTLPKYLSDEAEAWKLLERLRWASGAPVCPHCGTKDEKHYFVAAKSGERKTRTGKTSYRRLWKCRNAACRKQFSVLVDTVFESSKVPVSKWLLALWLFSAAKNGVSAKELEDHLNVSYQTAWFLAHRLREASKREPLAGLMRGRIVADETWFGGDPRNRHNGRPHNTNRQPRPVKVVPGQNKMTDKTPIFALVNRDTGEVRSHVVADVTGNSLRKVMSEHVDMAGSHLETDEARTYVPIGREFISHQTVDHSKAEYVRGDVTTNAAEGFFAQLKRSLDGTFHHVSKTHLPRYLAEFDFRYSTCKMTPGERLQVLIDRADGRRLTYRPGH